MEKELVRIAKSTRNKAIAFVTCCLCIMAVLMLAGAMDPVFAGSHDSQKDGDIGSIKVNNKTTYYDDVDELLNDLEEYDECEIRVDVLKDWNMGEDCQYIKIDSGSDSKHTKVYFDLHSHTIDRAVPDDEFDDNYLIFYIGRYADVTIDGGIDSKGLYRSGRILGGRFNESMFSLPEGGGAIYLGKYSNLTLKYLTVEGCKTTDGDGGAVFADNYSTLNMDESTIKNCRAESDGGGGVCLADDTTMTMSNSFIRNNFSDDEGGGVLVQGDNVKVTMNKGSKIEDNLAWYHGGGIAVMGEHAVIDGGSDDGCMLNGNRASLHSGVEEYSTFRHHGGGIYCDYPCTLRNINIYNNKTNIGNGGGAFLNDALSSDKYLIEDCVFKRNSAEDDVLKMYLSEGGGLYIDDDNAVVRNCQFIDNSAYNGGGGAYINDDDISFTDCCFDDNQAGSYKEGYDGLGGGMYINGDDTHFKSCSFTRNTAYTNGGAAYIDENTGSSSVEFSGTTVIKDNVLGDKHVHNDLVIKDGSHVNFRELTRGSRVFLEPEGSIISTYKRPTEESQKKYLSLHESEPQRYLVFEINESENTSLLAKVKEEKNKYQVSFDSRGGSGVDPQEILESNPIKEPKEPSKEDYVFKGWYTSPESAEELTGDVWDFSESVYQDITLYAGWAKGGKIEFNNNGGSGEMPAVEKSSGKYTLPENSFKAPEDKRYKGWSVDSPNGKLMHPGDTIKVDENGVTVYAVWENIPEKVKVKLNGNNGDSWNYVVWSVPTDKKGYVLPTEEYISGLTYVHNKKIGGWSYTPDGDPIADNTIHPVDDMTVYAIWEDKDMPDYESKLPSYDELEGRCGDYLETIELPEGFKWNHRFDRIGKNGTQFDMSYTPEDTDKYQIVDSIPVTIKVIHDYETTKLAPTCTEVARTINICKVCGNAEMTIPPYSPDEPGGALGHDYPEEWTIEGNVKSRICSRCGAVETEDLEPEAEHNFASEYTVDRPATFEMDGSKSIHCTDEGCNAVKLDSGVAIPAAACVNLSERSYCFEAEGKDPEVSVVNRDNQLLTEGTDYELDFADNTTIGDKAVTIRLKGEYSGERTEAYTITAASIKGQDITVSDNELTYTGKAVTPQVSIAGLEEGKDFEVEYKDNIDAGTAAITISGIGNFCDTKDRKFTIMPASLSEKTAKLSYAKATYSGKARKPSVKISGLTADKDFTVKYSGNTKIGKATVTIKGKGNYAGSLVKTFRIVPKKASIKSIRAGKKKLTVRMTAAAASTGGNRYQLAWKKSGSSKWRYINTKYRVKTVKKLRKGSRYQIKVRAYKVVDGTRYYGAWSKTKRSRIIK